MDAMLRVGGRDRRFAIRVPRSGPGGGPVPLVLALHGRDGDESMMREMTTFDHQAGAWGMAVAYPDGYERSWADGRGVTPAEEAGVDDVAFLRAIIDHAAERYGTWPDRTVVAGISNGAFMAHRMAVEASDRVAVVAAVAGGLPGALREVRPAHAVSALLIHGTADTLSPIDGGYSRHLGPNGEPRGHMLSLAETADHWRAIDGCPPGPGGRHPTGRSSRTTSEAGAGGTRVAAWTVFGCGHTWPGTPTPPEWDEPYTLEFDGAEEIRRFARPLLIPAANRRR